ncbi:GCN5-related N-acetyltransferase [Tieghemostelium lacteum]|uniref:N-alpha-acetyltransferase 60 n=1 Tax=Tieghemostelium lacteum TaxID=361077 RepID=A0A151Z4N9_TIELA|nr:GCN5-related N-acetyltransferase [Tieghemostelium lacteum]|eukprot:KYQ88933.1 GCN5-related N-acetyltransferase [Tieghemostelium lacteum]
MNFNYQENSDLIYKCFTWNDLEDLKLLQRGLFPVQYPITFYQKLLKPNFISVLVWKKHDTTRNGDDNIVITTTTTPSINISGGGGGGVDNHEDIPLIQNLRQPLSNDNSNDNSKLELIGVATGRVQRVLGYCGLIVNSIEGYIMTFGVKEQYRSRGIGSILLKNICDQLFGKGCLRVSLHVKDGNNKANLFYLKNDFIVEEKIPDYYFISNQAHNAFKMSKSLKENDTNKCRNNWKQWFSNNLLYYYNCCFGSSNTSSSKNLYSQV